MILPASSRRAIASSNLSARKSASAARTSSSRRRSSAAISRLVDDGGNRRATLSGLIVVSGAHENARSTCGSSAALPFGRQTSTRGTAAPVPSPARSGPLAPRRSGPLAPHSGERVRVRGCGRRPKPAPPPAARPDSQAPPPGESPPRSLDRSSPLALTQNPDQLLSPRSGNGPSDTTLYERAVRLYTASGRSACGIHDDRPACLRDSIRATAVSHAALVTVPSRIVRAGAR